MKLSFFGRIRFLKMCSLSPFLTVYRRRFHILAVFPNCRDIYTQLLSPYIVIWSKTAHRSAYFVVLVNGAFRDKHSTLADVVSRGSDRQQRHIEISEMFVRIPWIIATTLVLFCLCVYGELFVNAIN